MLISFPAAVARWGMAITGVLHVGAHLAEEAPDYYALGIRNVWWIEGNPTNIPRIEDIVAPYGHHVIEALITDQDGIDTEFHVTNYDSMSSSIFEFGTHTQFSPDTIFVEHKTLPSRTLDSLWAENGHFNGVNLLNMDLQGAELLALQGAEKLLPQIDYIYTEVNCKEVYQGCAQIGQLDTLLSDFIRMETHWVGDQGWGDAIYVRKGEE